MSRRTSSDEDQQAAEGAEREHRVRRRVWRDVCGAAGERRKRPRAALHRDKEKILCVAQRKPHSNIPLRRGDQSPASPARRTSVLNGAPELIQRVPRPLFPPTEDCATAATAASWLPAACSSRSLGSGVRGAPTVQARICLLACAGCNKPLEAAPSKARARLEPKRAATRRGSESRTLAAAHHSLHESECASGE